MTSDAVDQEPQGISKRSLLAFLLAVPVFFVLFMFLPAGTWAWTKGWLFIGVYLGSLLVVALYLWRVNPEVLAARSRFPKGTKRWDKIWLCHFATAAYSIMPVAALDDGRFHWFSVPWWVCGIGYLLFFIGVGILTWAAAVNKFFERTVRIQTERGHKVIDTGPYAIVRHPGYVGFTAMCAGSALCLGSLWALVPCALVFALLILRTKWEDQTLQAELPGYKEYTKRVRYKLLSGVW